MRISTSPLAFESKITCQPLGKLEQDLDDIEVDDDDSNEDSPDIGEAFS
jgi:hypothetical protein